MTTMHIQLPDELKKIAEARAAAAGCADVGDYIARLIEAEATGAPEGMRIDSDEALANLLRDRLDGPWVEMDADDFAQMRRKLDARLDAEQERQP